jgi:ABC-type tungstate transport system substrate-binding protein
MDHARSHDQEVVSSPGAVGDALHESLEVLESVGLTCGLGSPTTMAYGRVVSNVPRGAMVGGHVRTKALDLDDFV